MECSNCEGLRTPTLLCTHCNSPFCEDCSLYHPKVKAFKGHTNFEPYTPPASQASKKRVCSNCEEDEAKFECSACPPEDSLFCMGCSIVHPKVKAFRGHTLDTLNTEPSSKKKKKKMTPSPRKQVRFNEESKGGEEGRRGNYNNNKAGYLSADSVQIEEYIEGGDDSSGGFSAMLDRMRDIVDDYLRAEDLASRAVVLVVTFILYSITKRLFGRVSIVLLLAFAYSVIKGNTGVAGKDGNNNNNNNKEGGWLGGLASDLTTLLSDIGFVTGAKRIHNSDDIQRVRDELLDMQQQQRSSGGNTSASLDDYNEKEEFWHSEVQPALRKRPNMKVLIKGKG
jgi:hypothetical protein